MTRRSVDWAWPVLLAACGALVALAARGRSWSSASLESGSARTWVLAGAGVVTGLVLLALFGRGLWRAGRTTALVAALVAVAALGGGLIFAAVVAGRHATAEPRIVLWCVRENPDHWRHPEQCPLRFGASAHAEAQGIENKHGTGSSSIWILAAGAAALLFAGPAAFVIWRRSRVEPFEPEDDAVPDSLALAIDEALDDLRAEQDPRKAVIACYARMEAALAHAGFARVPSEAPLEYMGRALGRLHVRQEAIELLTRSFEWAKFSHHPVGEPMRGDAIEALARIRRDLRPRAAPSATARPAGAH
jgi:LPXTG-motif cell wall-anchored protein